jgi:hypothetical protein
VNSIIETKAYSKDKYLVSRIVDNHTLFLVIRCPLAYAPKNQSNSSTHLSHSSAFVQSWHLIFAQYPFGPVVSWKPPHLPILRNSNFFFFYSHFFFCKCFGHDPSMTKASLYLVRLWKNSGLGEILRLVCVTMTKNIRTPPAKGT